MRKIQKTFSLEPMTSRMPSVLPAYKDNVLYYFDDESLRDRDYQYPSNYGMIPLTVSYSSASTESGVTYAFECSSASTTISFERLSNWYYFFKEYYHLLNDYGHCDRTYASARDYYYYESGTHYADQMIYGTDEQTYIDLDEEFASKGGIVIIEGNSGGSSNAVDVGFYKWICDNIIPTYYISNEYVDYWKRKKLFYPDVIKWMAWFSVRNFYEEEYDIFSAATYDESGAIIEKEHWDCKKEEDVDCCDCEEYFNRGGKREYDKMKDWYDNLQENIGAMNSAITENLDCFIPRMDDKIQLHNSLDDLGQYSIFSTEYELGIDYRTASYGDTENTHGGTVVEMSGKTMILKDGAKGFCFSPYYMERTYDEDAWEDYTEKYMKSSLCPVCGYYGEIEDTCPSCGYDGEFLRNKNEFIADGYQYYAYDLDNVMYTGNTEDEVREKMNNAHSYDIIPTDAILIDDVLYPIESSEYGIYDTNNKYIGGQKFFVYREKDTSTPYTLVNSKKIYAEWYPNPNPDFDDKPCYYFTFFKANNKTKDAHCEDVDRTFNITNYKPFGRKLDLSGSTSGDVINYITYYGQVFQIEEGALSLTINDTEYTRVFGYSYNDNNDIMYFILEDNEDGTYSPIVADGRTLQEIPNSCIACNESGICVSSDTLVSSGISECEKIIIGLDYEPEIYHAKELSGQTISKLTDIEDANVLIDDVGNKIDGKYNPNDKDTYNHQPPEGTELDLLYEVGNTSNIKRINGLTIEDEDEFESEDTPNYFIGNIITDMVFYYKDVNGVVVEETIVPWSGSSLDAIHQAQSTRTMLEEDGNESGDTIIFDGDDIYCNITYYIGATLGRKKGEPFFLAYDENSTGDTNYNYGVQYNETVKFVKENREYYLGKELKKQIPMTMNAVSAHSLSYPVYVYKLTQELVDVESDDYDTFIHVPIARFKTEINLINDDLSSNYETYTDMSKYNGIQVAPTFKREYMLGISSLENVDSNIYIKRGINAAFEQHLKLGEVTSMEALEQYSNGYFKIMNNE